MEKPMPAQLRQIRLRRALRQDPTVDTPPLNLRDVVDLHTGHILHGHHTLRSKIPVHIGDLICGTKKRSDGGTVCICRLSRKVQEKTWLTLDRTHPAPDFLHGKISGEGSVVCRLRRTAHSSNLLALESTSVVNWWGKSVYPINPSTAIIKHIRRYLY